MGNKDKNNIDKEELKEDIKKTEKKEKKINACSEKDVKEGDLKEKKEKNNLEENKELKKDKKEDICDSKDEIIKNLEDRLLRQMAEFENFRKRNEKERSHAYIIGAKEVVLKLLPIVDNFERAMKDISPEEIEKDPFKKGMDLVYKQVLSTLLDLGVKEMDDNEFNPELHNAVMHIDDENFGENEIVEVFQKGYTYKNEVVRHAMVKVAN